MKVKVLYISCTLYIFRLIWSVCVDLENMFCNRSFMFFVLIQSKPMLDISFTTHGMSLLLHSIIIFLNSHRITK